MLPVDVFISVSVSFAFIKSLEFPYYIDSPWLPDWEGKCEFNGFCTFKHWAGDKCLGSEDLEFARISRVPLERETRWRGGTFSLKRWSEANLGFRDWKLPEALLLFFFGRMKQVRALSKQTCVQLFLIRQLSLFYLVSLHGWVVCRVFWEGRWEERRGGLCLLKESSSSLAGLRWGFGGESGHAALLLLVAGLCLRPSCRQLQFCNFFFFGGVGYSNITISWILLPFVYSCLLFILMEVHADTELRLKNGSSQYLQFFSGIFSQL